MKTASGVQRELRFPVQIVALIKGAIVAVGLALLLSLLIGLVVGLIDLDPIPASVYLFHYACILAGGFVAARGTSRLGWLHGGLVGLIYLGVMAWLFPPGYHMVTAPETPIVTGLLWSFLAGAAGGILGIKR